MLTAHAFLYRKIVACNLAVWLVLSAEAERAIRVRKLAPGINGGPQLPGKCEDLLAEGTIL